MHSTQLSGVIGRSDIVILNLPTPSFATPHTWFGSHSSALSYFSPKPALVHARVH
jgi:hypothetical protein